MYLACCGTSTIHADEAVKGLSYTCWSCGKPVTLKKGKIVSAHFAHKENAECNGWIDRRMTEWHLKMQSYFDTTEKPMEDKTTHERHIADAVNEKTKTVYEFQHSGISPEEVANRTFFYIRQGYRVVWVFDVKDKFDNGIIYPFCCQTLFRWKSAPKYFDSTEYKYLHHCIRIILTSSNCKEPFYLFMTWSGKKQKTIQIDEDGDGFYTDEVIFVPDFSFFTAEEIAITTSNRESLDDPFQIRFVMANPEYEKIINEFLYEQEIRSDYFRSRNYC